MSLPLYLTETLERTKKIATLNVALHDNMVPIVISLNDDTKRVTLAALTCDDDELQDALRELLEYQQPTAYIFVGEVWVTPFVEACAAVGGRVTELPLDDREEVVQLIAVERGNPDNQTFVATIVNREDGSRYLGEWRCIVSEWGPNILEPDAPPFFITEW